jgi:D-serine deaminase-like pyridoxal phosphate-dependent protein
MALGQIARDTVGQCAQEMGEAEGLVRGVNTFHAWLARLMRQRQPAADASCEIVAWAATGTFAFEAKAVECNELQVGSYVYSDPDYGKIGSEDGGRYIASEHCLFVLTSDHTVADAGLKPCSEERGQRGLTNVELTAISGERGKLTRGPTARNGLALGEDVRLILGHCDLTVDQHECYVRREKRSRLGTLPLTARPAGICSMDI